MGRGRRGFYAELQSWKKGTRRPTVERSRKDRRENQNHIHTLYYRTLTKKNYNKYFYGPKEKIPLTPLLSAELIHQILFFYAYQSEKRSSF